jgi:hypothetical protein
MTKKEYEEQLCALEADYEKKKRELDLAFAKRNNPVRIGDKVRSYSMYILVEKMVLCKPLGSPPCVKYFGTELKKDGTPKKSGKKDDITQINVIEINGEPYKYYE